MQKAPKSLWNANYLFLILVNFFVSISYSMVAMVISQYAVSMGMSVALAGSLTGAFSIASMVVRPFTGYINDHCEHRNLLMLATVGMGIATLFYGFTDSPVVLMALRLLHGAAFAFSSTVNMAVIPSLVPSNRITEGLSYYGIVQSVGVALGPSLGIAIIGDGQYQLQLHPFVSHSIGRSSTRISSTQDALPAFLRYPAYTAWRYLCQGMCAVCFYRCSHCIRQRTGDQPDLPVRGTAAYRQYWLIFYRFCSRSMHCAARAWEACRQKRGSLCTLSWTSTYHRRLFHSLARPYAGCIFDGIGHQDGWYCPGTSRHSGCLFESCTASPARQCLKHLLYWVRYWPRYIAHHRWQHCGHDR